MTGYLNDPAEIYRKSFSTIRAETDFSALADDVVPVALRLVHACGMTDIIGDLAYSPDAASKGRKALAHGAPVLCDARMVAEGIIGKRLPAANRVICTLSQVGEAVGTTRSAAAVDLWEPHLDGAVVAIGNAPTALFRLLELIAGGAARPAVVLGFPVGFVGAQESKDALAGNDLGLDYLVLKGRRGGSALAAAAVNALAGAALSNMSGAALSNVAGPEEG